MPYLSQTKAAKLAGVSRGTIANRIDAGTLSCAPEGIDPAELARVFPDIDGERIDTFLATGEVPAALEPGAGRSSPAALSGDHAAVVAHAAWLQGLVDEQRATIERKDRELRDALAEAEARAERREAVWLRQLETLTALLPAPERQDRGLWRRVFG